ncbi:Hpt domain-containing protein [Candidatus Magnetaquicoccus inordinatus]|uniref:Hpt domain-containing protein n=1 Tax=Candidatus Magnetaquicoccus inordinatus TaxID=2496818 RepID=UPI00187D25EC|nr:Hpt domain-containing protein [Candidatus Magnetaquicoccus inordinatus]
MAGEPHKVQVQIDRDLEEIIPSYLDNRRKDVLQLTDLLTKNDFAAMKVLGHRMKGTGAGYGLDAISQIGIALEQAAISQDSAALAPLIQELALYLEQLDIVYL